MDNITVSEIISATGGVLYSDDEIGSINGIAIDSRKVQNGFLFVPIIGERFDGHDFITAAMQNGATLTLSMKKISGMPYVLVTDTTQAFLDLSEYYMSKLRAKVIAITGSVGKTTTKEMVASALEKHFFVQKSAGNLNNQTGVPQTIFSVDSSHDIVVMEMGTNHFGEIDRIAKAGKPDICIFTNIGDAHIEFLGSREGVLKAKCEMLRHMKPDGCIIINGDDPLLSTLVDGKRNILTCGFGESCMYRAIDVRSHGLHGSEFTVQYGGNKKRITINVPGLHMVTNALIAFATGDVLGMSADEIASGILDYTPILGRLCIERHGALTIINDTYNANPTSMKASLNTLLSANGRKVAIIGDMLELGDDSPKYHEEVGKYAKEIGIELILCVGELAKFMAIGADTLYFSGQDELIAALPSLIKPNDTILIKASRGLMLERTVEFLALLGDSIAR